MVMAASRDRAVAEPNDVRRLIRVTGIPRTAGESHFVPPFHGLVRATCTRSAWTSSHRSRSNAPPVGRLCPFIAAGTGTVAA